MTTDLPDLAALDAAALRRELAERLGYTRGEELSPFVVYGDVSRGARFKLYRWVRPDGSYGEASSLHEFGDNTLFPDWPADPGAALALCLEIADPRFWQLVLNPQLRGGTNWQWVEARFETIYGPKETLYRGIADTPALALARLALSALRAGA
jgi:hypothetical protein